jgi:hypothetical protein
MNSLAITRRSLLLGAPVSSLSLFACTAPVPAIQSRTRYSDRPAVMAIGDSLYQGVRSLTFTSELAQHSPPVQVAQMLELPMAVPDPPRPTLFDLEAGLRQGGIVNLAARLRENCLTNSAEWLADGPRSASQAFDNIAVGGAQIESLYTDTFANAWPTVQTMVGRLRTRQGITALPDMLRGRMV